MDFEQIRCLFHLEGATLMRKLEFKKTGKAGAGSAEEQIMTLESGIVKRS